MIVNENDWFEKIFNRNDSHKSMMVNEIEPYLEKKQIITTINLQRKKHFLRHLS